MTRTVLLSLKFVLCLWGGKLVVCIMPVKKKNAKKKCCRLCGCKLEARCFVSRLWGGKLVVCITPVGRQACSFVLRLCGDKFIVLLPVWRQASVSSCLYGVKLVFHLKKIGSRFCTVLCLCGANLVCFFVRIRNKQRRKGKKEEKKHNNVGKLLVFHACRATSLYLFAACVAVSL